MFDFKNIRRDKTLVFDTETNALYDPSVIHVICTRDHEDNTREFRNVLTDQKEYQNFENYCANFDCFVGHNSIGYDYHRVFRRLLPSSRVCSGRIIDTLVLSRLINYSIKGGHSIEAWGHRFKVEKVGTGIEQWDTLTEEMVERCHSDTKINALLLDKFWRFLQDEKWLPSIEVEHEIALICAQMTENGFPFDKEAAQTMLEELRALLLPIDQSLSEAFPVRFKAIREITPRLTKAGTFNLNDFRWYDGDDLTIFNGGPFTLVEAVPFNPGSPRQVVERLNEAGWKPTEKTKGHIAALRDRQTPKEKLEEFKQYGWKVSEENLKTLPDTAPQAAKDLGKRIVLSSRISDLEEWLALVDDGDPPTIHGEFNPIGAWTQRLSHFRPNLANIPKADRKPDDNEFKRMLNDYNDRMRGLFVARPGHILIGTDADGIQMRIFAHYVDDQELIDALVQGKKENGTDIHTLHQKKLGEPCKNRDAAKTFIYAWLLGAGTAKVAEILETTPSRAKEAVAAFIESYPGLKVLKETIIPRDARRGYFEGLDGRKVICNDTHLMLSGYLQNGEAVIMKRACREWTKEVTKLKIPFWLRTWPHDEWQTETVDDPDVVAEIQRLQIQAIRNQATQLGLKCPLDGSSDVGYSWLETH